MGIFTDKDQASGMEIFGSTGEYFWARGPIMTQDGMLEHKFGRHISALLSISLKGISNAHYIE